MTSFIFRIALVASAIAGVLAADVKVAGVGVRSGLRTGTTTGTGTMTDIGIATSDILNRATALLNKNILTTGNNIFITRSNLIFTQNDRMAMRKKVQEALEAAPTTTTGPMGTAVLTKSVLRAVSAPTSDATLQTKASAVVAAKGGDQTTLMSRIADLVDTAARREMDHEQALQSQTPSGVVVLIGTKDVLRQPSAIVNKNIAITDTQINVARSKLTPSQNDKVSLTDRAKVADAILPGSVLNVGQLKTEASDEGENYRVAFMYPKTREGGEKSGQQEVWGPGWGMGWRYPLTYWNLYGAGLYGRGCGLGIPYGSFYYC